MLDLFMKSDEYYSMIETKVDQQPEYKSLERDFEDALKKVKLNRDEYNEIDGTATTLAYTARDMAYKAGFEDGIRLVMDCARGRNNINE